MTDTWRLPFLIGSAGRLAYGLGCMLAPEWMAANRLAPQLRGHPDPRMNLRGFGGAQTGIALYTLATATTPAGARQALTLNALVDGLDAVVSALEIRDRGGVDMMGAGGIAFNTTGLTCWAAAARALRTA
jgi:hypothetical protein